MAAEVELNSPDGQSWLPLRVIFAVSALIGACTAAMFSFWMLPDVAAFYEALAGKDPMPFLKVFFWGLWVVLALLVRIARDQGELAAVLLELGNEAARGTRA